MSMVAIIFGALLDLIGVVGFVMSGAKSFTALIPSALGTLILLCGILGLLKPELRKHAMHAAATLGLLGFLASARMLQLLPAALGAGDTVEVGGKMKTDLAIFANSATAIVCLVFVLLCVQSFVKARRARMAQQ